MNVLMINPAIRLTDKPRNIPHGLAILANIIREKLTINPTFIDINAHRYSDKEIEDLIKHSEFDVVLIGGLSPVYRTIIQLSKLLRMVNPGARIIAGGSAAMLIPEVLLKNSEFDIVCTGEGEITTVNLLRRLRDDLNAPLDDIAGICYKNGRDKSEVITTPPQPLIQNLDEQSALPAYDLLPMDIYLANPVVGIGRDIDFIASRGCPYRCTFCYQPWGQKFRAHSVDFITKALIALDKEYGIDFVSFQDDEFIASKQRVHEFCEKRNRLLPNLLWSCTGRANIIANDDSIVKIMKDSGCVLISFGFESGSQKMLDSMRKNVTINQMEKTVITCRKNGMPVPVSFIIGMPGEDNQSCQETLDFCLRNNLPLDSLMFATPYPGTEIYDFAISTGRIDKDLIHEFALKLGDARDFIINLTDCFSDEELIKKREEMIAATRENYERYITQEERMAKMRDLFGPLLDRSHLDENDLEHRAKHGGIGIF